MHGRDTERPTFRLDRRRWLSLALAGGSVSLAWGAEDRPDQDERETTEVRTLAQRAGIENVQLSRTSRFLAIGDASDLYSRECLRLVEAVASAFLEHFSGKGFTLALPGRRLTLVTLGDSEAYARFSGDTRPVPYGMYDGVSNRLLIYDLRNRRDELGPRAEVLNRQILIHEAQHLLAFNTGLIDNPRADHLRSIVEGLAIYGETYLPGGKAAMGLVPAERLQYLSRRLKEGARWLAAERLLADNSCFLDVPEAEVCQAYAQSWLLVHYLLSEPPLTARFRSYLSVYNRGDANRRLDNACRHLGSLAQLDQNARRHAGL